MVRMITYFKYFMWLIIITLLCSCSTRRSIPFPPHIFKNTKSPYTRDLDNTPLVDVEQDGKIIRITEPFSGYGLYSEIMSNAIGDIAEKNGIQEVYFADMEEFSILGIFRHNKLYIYGK